VPICQSSRVAYFRKKIKKGKEYFYLCENARVDGKPRCVKQIYLGSIERVKELVSSGPSLKAIEVKAFGAVWLANFIEQKIQLAKIIDDIVPQPAKQTGLSVGEYFLYAVINMTIDARSKQALPDWFRASAIQEVRPADINALDSDGFWKKWNKVSEEHLRSIAARLFERLATLEPSASDCCLFDTTNFYTYMASDTPSDLAKRGKNKEGKDWLRQVGLALLVDRETRLPLYYREYEGNRHDSKVFAQIMGEILDAMRRKGQDEVTVVFDKGMNAEENIEAIDSMPGTHFITTYSPSYAEEFFHIDKSRFTVLDTPRNRELHDKGKDDDRLVAYRASGEFWGKERVVVVTHNPLTAAKQRYAFDEKLQKLQRALFDLRSRVRKNPTHWKSEQKILARYHADCEELHLPKNLYAVTVGTKEGRLSLGFCKDYYRIGRHIDRFGKNILISDRVDWSTERIALANLDRYEVEQAFCQSKDDDQVAVQPLRHWTDSKIRCHMLTCIAALCYLRLIERHLLRAGVNMTAARAMEHMRGLHSCLCLSTNLQATRMLETPNIEQARILAAFGFQVVAGILQPIQ